MPNQTDFEVVSVDQLKKVAPFSRHKLLRGRGLFKPLRRELVHADPATIQDVDVKISKCMEMAGAFTDAEFTDHLNNVLSRRFGSHRVLSGWLAAMLFQRRFEEALHQASIAARETPSDVMAQLREARFAMLAARPEHALKILRRCLPDLERTAPKELVWVVEVLVEAGEADFIIQNVPQLADQYPFVRRATELVEPSGTTPIYCITLERDHLRMQGTRPFLSHGGPLIEVTGVLGSSMPETVARKLVRGNLQHITPAELGCSLSHLATWERVANDCAPDEYALVVEDDSRFIYGPGRGLTEVIELARSRNAPLVFVNQRACWEVFEALGGEELNIFPVQDRIGNIGPEVAPQNPGWGADGYIVSGAMAAHLARNWLDVGILGAVDWQLQIMCHESLKPWHDHRIMRNIYNVLKEQGTWPRLDGYVCNMPIIVDRDFGFSSINSSN